MSSTPWSEQEIADLRLPYSEFRILHPERSDSAYRHKRLEVRGYAPKAKPQVLDQDDDEISDDELWDEAVRWGKVLNRAHNNPLHHHIALDVSRPIIVAFPSDWHIGAEGTDLARIKEDCELIQAHPDVYCALGGDPVDNVILEKMASAARSQSIGQIDIQWRLFRRRVQLLVDSHSLLWVSAGNHDAWTIKAAGIDGNLSALANIPVCYTGEGGFVHLRVGKQTYVIYRKHKPTRFNTQQHALNFLKTMLQKGTPIEFDVGISEHFHQADFEVYEYRPGSKMDRVLIACGSYKVKDPYAEGLGYYGGGYGVPSVIFYPDRRKMMAFSSITDALEALDGVSSSYAA